MQIQYSKSTKTVGVYSLLFAALCFMVAVSWRFFQLPAPQDLTNNPETGKVLDAYITPLPTAAPISRNVLIIDMEPTLPSSGKSLVTYKNWNRPETLASQFRSYLQTASNSRISFAIVAFESIASFPVLADGRQYNETTYLACLQDSTKCYKDAYGNLMMLDYTKFLNSKNYCDRFNSGVFNEIWMFGGPYFGFFEANQAGANAFHTNGSVITGTTCNKPLTLMGFNYERSMDFMVEDFLHRTEGTMEVVYKGWNRTNPVTNWDKFAYNSFESKAGFSGCGWAHLTPGSTGEYIYNVSGSISTYCDEFLNYPNISTSNRKLVTSGNWGATRLGFFSWILARLPNRAGTGPDGKLNDWWRYSLMPEIVTQAVSPTPTVTPKPTATPSPTPKPAANTVVGKGYTYSFTIPTDWNLNSQTTNPVSKTDPGINETVFLSPKSKNSSLNINIFANSQKSETGTIETITIGTNKVPFVKAQPMAGYTSYSYSGSETVFGFDIPKANAMSIFLIIGPGDNIDTVKTAIVQLLNSFKIQGSITTTPTIGVSVTSSQSPTLTATSTLTATISPTPKPDFQDCTQTDFNNCNLKLTTKFATKEAFMVADTSWQNVLPLVPLTTWTDYKGNVQAHPTLIYHQEGNNVDVDSTIGFLQKYKPGRVSLFASVPTDLPNLLNAPEPLGIGIASANIKYLTTSDYFSYWATYHDVVYVNNDYGLAVIASTYASLINAPLVISGSEFDKPAVFTGKNIICVGNTSPANVTCNERYDQGQLQAKYKEKTNTDKVIMINPNDLNVTEKMPTAEVALYTDKSSQPITKLFSSASLSAAFLASSKHELILTVNSSNYLEVKSQLKNEIEKFYLTNNLDQSTCKLGDSCSTGFTTDQRKYDVASNSITLNYPQNSFQFNKNNYIGLSANVIDCGQKKTQVLELWVDNQLIKNNVRTCINADSDYLESPTSMGWITFSIPDGTILTNKKIEIKFSGSRLLFFQDALFQFFTYSDIAKQTIRFDCLKSNQNCSISTLQEYLTNKPVAKGLTTYKFSNIDVNSNYTLDLSTDQTGTRRVDVNINEFKIPNVDVSIDMPFINIPQKWLNKETTIKITPTGDLVQDYHVTAKMIDAKNNIYKGLSSLTIVANANVIPQAKEVNPNSDYSGDYEVDGRDYSDFNSDGLIDIAVGRIIGITSSDASSMINRSVFIKEVTKGQSLTAFIAYAGEDTRDTSEILTPQLKSFWTDQVKSKFAVANEFVGWENVALNKDTKGLQLLYSKSNFTIYRDHGWMDSFSVLIGSNDMEVSKMTLNSPIIVNTACITCGRFKYFVQNDPVARKYTHPNSFCAQNARRGALGMNSAVEITNSTIKIFEGFVPLFVTENLSVGNAFKFTKNNNFAKSRSSVSAASVKGDLLNLWIGDPTITFEDFVQ